MTVTFDNTYARLPARFFSPSLPEPVSAPDTIRVNDRLAAQLGFDPEWLASKEGAQFAVGNTLLPGSEPIATVYAGHQFGGFSPRLGDGRAILLGEVLDESGRRFDVQLKGSGRTMYSRGGDGRSPLGPVLREYIISEAMAGLGIPTTRALIAASTGDKVRRDAMLPGAVLVRVARSHIRIGTFEYFASLGDADAIRILVEHVAARHYPELIDASPLDLLRAVARRQAELIAQWMLVGFIHGVMNTDNMLLSGETIDYGPCAFMNEYDPATVFSSIDHQGRYAYGNQPPIAQWNLARLASALLEIADEDGMQEVLGGFREAFRSAYGKGMAQKLGIADFGEDDWELIEDFLEVMYVAELDYTSTFLRLTELAGGDTAIGLELPESFGPWLSRWHSRIDQPAALGLMRGANPLVIPRNHLVEAAISDAVNHGDYEAFHALVDAVSRPFTMPENLAYLQSPKPEERVHATFCGT